MKRLVFMILGCITFGLGVLGVFLPLLPTVPFFLATGFFWVNSSEKLHEYLMANKYYQKYITDMVVNRNMPRSGLVVILVSLFVLLSIPFIMVDNFWMRISLVCVFLAHAILLPIHFSKKRSSVLAEEEL